MFDDFAGPAQIDQYANFKQPRGGTVELAGGQPLISEAKIYLQGLFPGTSPKDLMRASPLREHLAALTMQGEDLPQLSNRADLDPGLRDVFGVPVARIIYQNHPYEMDASAFYQPFMFTGEGLMADVLNASAAPGEVVPLVAGPATSPLVSGPVPTSAHIMGTLRMGNDPATSVTDPGGKFHGLDNLYAADGSLFPTSGGMNPSLTIMALGYRVGCSIIHPHNPLSVAKKIDHALLKP
jgi:choline dehydrogenase-like flavoprotein